MKKRLSNKARFFEQVTLTTDDEVCVGIDVHKKNCHIAVRLNDAIVLTCVNPAGNQALIQPLSRPRPGPSGKPSDTNCSVLRFITRNNTQNTRWHKSLI